MAHARHTDPQTSHEAAATVSNLTETKAAILKALNHPRTDEELAQAYNNMAHAPRVSPSGLRTRRAELVKVGLIRDTGARTKMASGRSAIIWARS